MNGQNEIYPDPRDSLARVCKILRFNSRHELASLLNHADLEIEGYDIEFADKNDAPIIFSNAVVFVPLSDLKRLRSLGSVDNNAILDAIRELWPVGESGGTYITKIDYRINTDSLIDDPLTLFNGPTGWKLVDRQLDSLRHQMAAASTEEEFQQVGLLCRESLISLAQAVFDPELHPPLDSLGQDISSTDVKRMMGQYVEAECGGPSNREVRKCIKSSYDLANAVQHGRNSTYREAALCVQATFNVVGLIEVISGKRTHAAGKEGISSDIEI